MFRPLKFKRYRRGIPARTRKRKFQNNDDSGNTEIYLGLETVSLFKHLPRQKRKGDGENCYFLFSTRALRQLDREISHFSNRMIGRATFAVAQGPLTVSLCIRFKYWRNSGFASGLRHGVQSENHGNNRRRALRSTARTRNSATWYCVFFFSFLSFPGEIL